MKSQLNFTRIRSGRQISTILLLLMLSLFVAVDAQAKKKPDPGPVVAADNLVRWGGDEPTPGIVQADYQFCSLSEAAADMSSGKYTCNLGTAHVFYDFSKFICEVAHKNGEDWRCSKKGSQYFLIPDLEYSYRWNGDCTSDIGCDVTVVNRFSDLAILGGPVDQIRIDPALDRLTFEGFGHITNSTANPFDVPQSIVIDYMHISFIGVKGKDKVLALCRATPLHDEYPVTFETMVVE